MNIETRLQKLEAAAAPYPGVAVVFVEDGDTLEAAKERIEGYPRDFKGIHLLAANRQDAAL